jgi:O-antigen/teichoic acid export membrane protein
MKPVLALFFAAFVASIYTRFDLVLLGFLSGDKNVAFYNVDKKLALLATSIVISLSTVLVPRLSYYFKKGLHEEFRRLAEKSINFIYFLGFPIVTGVVILAPEILHVFGGADFVEGARSLRFIAPVIILESMNSFLSLQILLPTGREGRITVASSAAAAVNLGLNFLFIPLYHHNGITAVLVVTHLTLFFVQYMMARGLIRFSLFKRESLHYLVGSFFVLYVCSGVKALGYGPYRTFVLSVSFSFLIYGLYMVLVKDPYINISFGMLKKGWNKVTGTGRQWEELE